MKNARIVIVSPALQDANNGNWTTAQRWQRMLASTFDVQILRHWSPAALSDAPDVMLALHARRSADSIAAWAQYRVVARKAPGLAVVLTGTDLYRDIQVDAPAQQSLQQAQLLVTLQERGPQALPPEFREKARVIFPSMSIRRTLPKPARHLRVAVVGHLRDEKSPQTIFALARLLRARPDIRINHIGAPLDSVLGEQARATARQCPAYRWLGAQPREATRRLIQRAHLLLHPSSMEGGAHVVMEAVCSGTPVLASRIDGNVGMLGQDYAGLFAQHDADAVARWLLVARAAQEVAGQCALGQLMAQCALRAKLFAPQIEQARLRQLVADLLPQDWQMRKPNVNRFDTNP